MGSCKYRSKLAAAEMLVMDQLPESPGTLSPQRVCVRQPYLSVQRFHGGGLEANVSQRHLELTGLCTSSVIIFQRLVKVGWVPRGWVWGLV